MNYLFLFLSLIVLGISTVVLLRKQRPLSLSALLSVALVGLLSTAFVIIASFIFGSDPFGIIHVLYIILTISVPATAAIALSISKGLQNRYKAILVCLLVLAPVGIYATHIEPFWLRTDAHILYSDIENSKIRVGVFSDLQTTEIGDYEKNAIKEMIDNKPDILLIPGDFYHMPGSEFQKKKPEFVAAMKELSEGIEHVFVVNGNTDTVSRLNELVKGTGVVLLDNQISTIEIDGSTVHVGGVTLFSDEKSQSEVAGELLNLESQDSITILLSHKPDAIFLLPEDERIDLVVAGHTHGGQLSLPIVGPPLTLTKVPKNIAAGGLNTLNQQKIYVSTGVGRERGQAPQFRFGVRPSIGVIDIEGN